MTTFYFHHSTMNCPRPEPHCGHFWGDSNWCEGVSS